MQQDGVDSLFTFMASIVVDVVNHSWSVHILGKRVPETCEVLSKFSQRMVTPDLVQRVICTVDKSIACPGNTDEKFIQLYRQACMHA